MWIAYTAVPALRGAIAMHLLAYASIVDIFTFVP